MNTLDLFQDSPLEVAPPSAARRLLFRDSTGAESPSEVVQWWERRRLPFNIAVGTTGLVSLTTIALLGAIGPHQHAHVGPPLIAVIVYAVMANVAYTSGWLLELLLLRPLFGRRSGTVAATMFRYGLAFSVGLTAIPIGIGVMDFGVRVVRWALGLGAA